MSIRAEKVGGLIRELLSEIVRPIASEINAGLLTITSVRVTDDLKHARIYVSAFGGRASTTDVLEVLEQQKRRIRSELAHKMKIRFVPELSFYRDDTLEEMQQIQTLLNSVKKDEDKEAEDKVKDE